jgi:cytochrome c oxidase cbb3-type subunit 3
MMYAARTVMMSRLACGMAAIVTFALSATAVAQSRGEQYSPADVRYGARLFGAQCTVCHGASGDAVAGVDLRSGRIKRAANDAELRSLIATGIPGTAMPAFKFDPPELTAVVAYLRTMREFDAVKTPLGEPARGKAVFEGAGGCGSCHRINGKGPRLAPDLSEIGSARTADALQKSILEPDAAIQPSNRSVRAVTRDGRVISGRRLNEDTYSVQLIDERERLVSLLKSDLREYKVLHGSSMPSFRGKISDSDLADLVAYLLSLKGL